MKLASNRQKLTLYQPVQKNLQSPGSFGKESSPFSEGTSCVHTEAVNEPRDNAMLRYSDKQIFCNF